jgi:hypothetical protein
MNHRDEISKSLTRNTLDEKGWRKTLAGAEGSHSKELAEKNINRLHSERQTLLHRQSSFEARKLNVMRAAVMDGIFTDHLRDGVCQELVTEGWLVRAEAISRRGNRATSPTYLPTELAAQEPVHPDQEQLESERDSVQLA